MFRPQSIPNVPEKRYPRQRLAKIGEIVVMPPAKDNLLEGARNYFCGRGINK